MAWVYKLSKILILGPKFFGFWSLLWAPKMRFGHNAPKVYTPVDWGTKRRTKEGLHIWPNTDQLYTVYALQTVLLLAHNNHLYFLSDISGM